MVPLHINRERLLDRHRLLASFGDTGNGGVIRPALSDEETAARRALLDIARQRGYACAIDPIGNIFIRRSGTDDASMPLRVGSHLDSQIPGGNYDGVYGVLAGLEVLESLDDHRVELATPVELVIWNNEEGARFSPTTMGSAVHAGELDLGSALAAVDQDAKTVGDELSRSLPKLGSLSTAQLGNPSLAYVEAHIEQGPMLEAGAVAIGVVTGIQGIVQLAVRVTGEEAHAGTTPRARRKDALLAALDFIAAIRTIMLDPEDSIRFTVGRLTVSPGTPNTVPSEVVFTIDLRHPDQALLLSLHDRIKEAAVLFEGPCSVSAHTKLNSPPVNFAPGVKSSIAKSAAELGLRSIEIASGATHDAKFMAKLCPTGMIFIPCRDGISHNEREWAEPDHMIAGADVLLRVVVDLSETLNRQPQT
ncbi:M20 family metallo-hydrolase [Rhizobium ruizarguesonis]|uniref:M20 family metallo-hydrolase n=1 Tax=Rhizobium TaxID=379 RepID=UPI0013BEF33E|nr:M20 family metallo-hydrolase [Rhizobium ruizarguesonis]MBY5828615.1 M20 family metallo-hydrolase [Rhizobium leguminosarum]MBY5856352.1 M20 family metallo-hydrolase [Rhizobium leguminosarum]NEI96507.1 hydantoinase/carbamoylase family amidase [Rhizobium ruizarguesonis]NEJ33870.1 hydantoinase/carbamoylase family amidase [Rhizobium ruizarguesonis]